MELKLGQLVDSGFRILWLSGEYCRVTSGQDEVLLRWDGANWRIL